jgi:hypothetical protein
MEAAGVDDRLEGGAGLPSRLQRPVELAPLEVVAADEGEHLARLDLEGEQGTLHQRLLEQGQAGRAGVLVVLRGRGDETGHVADLEDLVDRLHRLGIARRVRLARPAHVLEQDLCLAPGTEGDAGGLLAPVDLDDHAHEGPDLSLGLEGGGPRSLLLGPFRPGQTVLDGDALLLGKELRGLHPAQRSPVALATVERL